MDATEIPLDNYSVDVVIANHILEHIPYYNKALSEFFRVLIPGGFTVLQTPYSQLLKKNFTDESINTNALRRYFHGEEDHVITFGHEELFYSIKAAGFKLKISKHSELLADVDAYYYGVNPVEDLILVEKPSMST